MDKLSYALGYDVGQQMKPLGIKEALVKEDFIKGFEESLNEVKDTAISLDDAKTTLEEFFKDRELKFKKKIIEESEAFLNQNKLKEGVKTTASGLQYEVITEGEGKVRPTLNDTVVCHYEGAFIDGNVFDSSQRRNQPAKFTLKNVILGWQEGLQLMTEGSHYRFYIPSQLAYGENGVNGAIPPHAVLIFDIQLIEIKK